MYEIKGNYHVCEGCLSSNRNLSPLGKYLDLYHELMGQGQKMHTTDDKVPLICWECLAMFKKIQNFQHMIQRAHTYLTIKAESVMESIDSLSNLTTKIKIEYDYELITEESSLDINVKLEHVDDEIKPDYESDYANYEIPTEILDSADNNDVIENKSNIIIDSNKDNCKKKIMGVKRQKRKMYEKSGKNYRIFSIPSNEKDKRKFYKRVRIDEEELQMFLAKQRTLRNYKTMAFKCDSCIKGFPSEEAFGRHKKLLHSKSIGEYTCDVCDVRFKKICKRESHVREHYVKYVCGVCGESAYRRDQLYSHFEYAHHRLVECLKCGVIFEHCREFFKHYKLLHKTFICDYCGKECKQKRRLINHIKVRHTPPVCKVCNRTYSSFDALLRHYNKLHVKGASENTYCVECDLLFDNMILYKNHLKVSVKHASATRSTISCPVCNKIFSKKYTMNNHYNLVHLQQSNHHCAKCNRYFLTRFRLRQHTASAHDKLARPKNKMCTYCGRGFAENRILVNHIRTHTGERPFACPQCSMSFAQKQALVNHLRAIHKITNYKIEDKIKNK